MESGGGRSGGGGGSDAPTGCYKCGRPGHWSRDCPDNPNSTTNNAKDNDNDQNQNPKGSGYNPKTSNSHPFKKNADATSTEKPKKLPRSRPKLTADGLLSDNGLGHILRHFPRAFKYRGRGHEVNDLGNLLGLYAEWHSRLLPYYSFEQFVHKVEQVGNTRRVRKCLQELRERVANGLDPANLHEPQVQQDILSQEQDVRDTEEPNPQHEDTFEQDPGVDILQENMLDEVWEKTIEEPSEQSHDKREGAEIFSGGKEQQTVTPANGASSSSRVVISEEQRARMEANRLKALERAAARTQSSLH